MHKLIPEILNDIPNYSRDLEGFLRGEINPQKFKALRVPRGMYGQRKEKLFMVRIRVVAGIASVEQIEKLCAVSKTYGSGVLHVTTRQDIQIHNVKIEDTIKVVQELSEVGLSPWGGGGNTVRNITCCKRSGICRSEVFDVSGYVYAFSEYLLRNPRNFNLPRKFKIVFTGCQHDCAYATVADLGFIAKVKNIDGKVVRGFKVYIAGGLGMHSRVASLLTEFIEEGDAIYFAEAALNLFDKHGDRKNRHQARLHFVIDRLGESEFKKIFFRELEIVKKDKKVLTIETPKPDLKAPKHSSVDLPNNARPQKQPGYSYIPVRLALGDISADAFFSLAGLLKKFGKSQIRTTQQQNIIIPWVHDSELGNFYQGLKEIGLASNNADKVSDVVSCMGALTCNLGICNSRGLASALSGMLEAEYKDPDLFKGINIKVSGCPNSCGQHQVAPIGFFGASRRSGSRVAPFYHLVLGGKTTEADTHLAEDMGIVPAKNAVKLTRDLLGLYLKEKAIDKEKAKALVKKYEYLPTYEEDKDFYFDWGKDEEFSLSGIGPGECGAGVLDMIEADLKEGKIALEAGGLYKSLSFSSRALLVTQGIEPKTDLEVFKNFKEKFINSGIISKAFADITEVAWELNSGVKDESRLKELSKYCRDLLADVAQAFKEMDSAFKFKVKYADDQAGKVSGAKVLDLKGVKCPLNYVQAKIFLEDIEKDGIVEIYLDEGEPIQNVPVSLKNDGQEIISIEKLDGNYKVVVKKKV